MPDVWTWPRAAQLALRGLLLHFRAARPRNDNGRPRRRQKGS